MSEYRNPCVLGRELARIIETEQFMTCCIKKEGFNFHGQFAYMGDWKHSYFTVRYYITESRKMMEVLL